MCRQGTYYIHHDLVHVFSHLCLSVSCGPKGRGNILNIMDILYLICSLYEAIDKGENGSLFSLYLSSFFFWVAI